MHNFKTSEEKECTRRKVLTQNQNAEVLMDGVQQPPAEGIDGNMSTSSTDSGVIMLDNKQLNQTKNENNNNNKSENDNLKNLSVPCSPSVSLRSIASSLVDSDFDTDAEQNKEYVIRKLGTEKTYPPDSGAEIPQLNKGLEMISQMINAGDGYSEQQQISSTIGSIAVSNSSDVTFGDKHYYEGPVTIQQFLIEKAARKDCAGGVDNLAYMQEKQQHLSIETQNKQFAVNNEYNCLGIKLTKRNKCFIIIILLALIGMVGTILYALVGASDMRTSKQSLNGDSTRIIYPISTDLGSIF